MTISVNLTGKETGRHFAVPPLICDRMSSTIDLGQLIIEGLKKDDDVSISFTPSVISIRASTSETMPILESEIIEAEHLPAIPESNNLVFTGRRPSVTPPWNNLSLMPDQLDIIQAQTDVLNIFNRNHSAKATRTKQIMEESFQAALQSSAWELASTTIIPLINSPGVAAEFQWKFLPDEIVDDVWHISHCTGWEMVATLLTLLGVTSIAQWGRYMVCPWAGWEEPLLIYLCVVSPSGTRKTFFVKTLKSPLLAFRSELLETFEAVGFVSAEGLAMRKATTKMAKKMALKLIVSQHCDKTTGAVDLEAIFQKGGLVIESTANVEIALENKEINSPEISIDNVSPKKLLQIMKANGEMSSIFEAEIGFLEDIIKDRDLGARLFLKANCMEEFTYETCRNQVRLLLTALNIIYVIQPKALAKICENRHLVDLGVTPRFDIFFASEPEPIDSSACDDISLQNYFDKILSRLRRNYTQERPRPISCIRLTPEAQQLLRNYMDDAVNALKNGRYQHMDSYVRKHHGKAVRWAAAIHCYRHDRPEDEPISFDTMRAGIAIADYIVPHADYAYRDDGMQSYDLAQRILDKIKSEKWAQFSSREIQRRLGSKLDMATIEAALILLERHNIIRIHQKPKGGLQCLVHPKTRYL